MKQRFSVTGMTCAACSAHVEKAVKSLAGVTDVQVNLLQNSMTVDFNEQTTTVLAIETAVKRAGYGIRHASDTTEKHTHSLTKRLVISLVFLLLLMVVSMGHMLGMPLPPFMEGGEGAWCFAAVQLLLVAPIVVMNRVYFIKGIPALFRGAPTMDSLIAVGSAAALIHGLISFVLILVRTGEGAFSAAHSLAMNLYIESAGMILTLVTVGKLLESRSKSHTTDAISRLVDLAPTRATVLRHETEQEIAAADVVVGDTVVIRAGQTVPVDGIVLSGSGAVNEAAITGESLPVEKLPGDTVTGATVARTGYFTFRATHVGEDTTLSRIIRLVEEAGSSKAPISRLADKVAGIFVPVVLGIALVTALVWLVLGHGISFALSLAISVLVISCPCALGLATPTAIMVGTGKGAEHGILIKSAESLELTHKIDTVVLDKTGTVTEGHPVVTDVIPFGAIDTARLLSLTASLEHASEHPLASAITEAAAAQNLTLSPVDHFETLPGKGIRGIVDTCRIAAGNARLVTEEQADLAAFSQAKTLAEQGKTPLFILVNGTPAGMIAVSDPVKPEAAEAIATLHKYGINTVMLTGDNTRTATAVCTQVGIARCVAEVLPQDKEAEIRRLQAEGRRVAMIGDGINDAPALIAADVGIAIGAGTDIALDCADIILVRSSLTDAATAFRLSRATVRNIKQNLFWAFFYNLCGIPLAAGVFYPLFGLTLNPMFGAAAMSLSSLFVVSNALRLRYFRTERDHKSDKKKESSTMQKTLTIEGMMCQHCRAHAEKALNEIPGVTATVTLETATATVTHDGTVSDETLKAAIKEAGYEVTAIS